MTVAERVNVPAVKICGVCHADDAAHAAAGGASYVGIILSPGFARSRTVAEAMAVCAAAGTARRVGVFVDAPVDEMIAAATMLQLDVVQLHGHEPAGTVELIRAAVPCDVWKAVRVAHGEDVTTAAAVYAAADALLLEGKSLRGIGGTGTRFDWAAIAAERNRISGMRVVVAGGLTPDNVAAMITALRPDVVDVSSGVEADRASAGRKSAVRVTAFLAAVRNGGLA